LMFTEWDFLDRFAAARDAGFAAVECLFPYDHPTETIAGRLESNGLELVLFNMPPGDWAGGDRGLAAIPARRAEFQAGLDRAQDYARATGARRIHMMAGVAPAVSADAEACFRDSARAA